MSRSNLLSNSSVHVLPYDMWEESSVRAVFCSHRRELRSEQRKPRGRSGVRGSAQSASPPGSGAPGARHRAGKPCGEPPGTGTGLPGASVTTGNGAALGGHHKGQLSRRERGCPRCHRKARPRQRRRHRPRRPRSEPAKTTRDRFLGKWFM